MALEVIRHHRLIELYLHEAPDVPWDEVHVEAEQLDHALSPRLVERIAERLGEQHVQWTPAVKRAMQKLEQDGNGNGNGGDSKQDLLEQAKKLEIKGRSKMNKQELQQAIADGKK